MPSEGCGDGADAVPQGLQFGDLISFEAVEVGVSWYGNIVFLFGSKRISNPQTMLHLKYELTG